MVRNPVKCSNCDEFIFSIEVLRHNTSSKPVISNVCNIKYCPFCGEKIGVKYETKQK
jgi:hypothetical protein